MIRFYSAVKYAADQKYPSKSRRRRSRKPALPLTPEEQQEELRWKACGRKEGRYKTLKEADEQARSKGGGMHGYKCDFCPLHHFGH